MVRLLILLTLSLAAPLTSAAQPLSEVARRDAAIDVIYVPTSMAVVDAMLALAEVGSGDVLYDLGSGDGRIPIAAAQRFGVRAVGVEINPRLVAMARADARRAGVSKLAKFRRANLFRTDLREATVVTLYLLDTVNLRLRPKLLRQLPPGARIVSHTFDMGDWPPERELHVDGEVLYLWRVPAVNP